MNPLDKVIELIEKGWCQGASARDNDGNPVEIFDLTATNYCTIGAIVKITGHVSSPEAKRIRNAIRKKTGLSVNCWNDSNTKENVIKTLKELRDGSS